MEPTVNKEAILVRIKKLLKHAESAKSIGSLHEAETFAAKAQELLLEYNLSMADVAKVTEADEDKFANWIYGESISYKDLSGDRWKFDLINVLTKYNFCSFTFNRHLKNFRVFGHMSNVDTVVWLYNFMTTTLLRLSKDSYCAIPMNERYKHGTRRFYIQSYLLGLLLVSTVSLKNNAKNSANRAR